MQFWDRLCVQVLVGTFSLLLAGCHNDGSRVGPSVLLLNQQAVTLSGSVGDGPVADATLELRDRAGDVVANGMSDARAHYQIVVPEQTLYPITLRSIGGTDLVTGRAPDVPLELVIADPSQTIGNLSPLSTFAARVAQCASSEPSPAQLDAAWAQVLDRMNMGFDAEQAGNPATTPVTPDNIAELIFASEGLAEAMRRATAALAASTPSVTTDAMIDVVACDLRADSMIDGRGGVAASERVAAVFQAASGAVLLEMAAKQLRVDGSDAMAGMDRAIAQAMPGAATTVSTTDAAVTPALIRQTRDALAVFQVFGGDPVGRYVMLLDQTPIGELTNAVRLEAATPGSTEMSGFAERVALADDRTVAQAMALARVLHEASPPLVSFASVPEQVRPGTTARLSWASTQATRCQASGGWSGTRAADGTLVTAPVERPTTYRLDCTGLGGTATAQLTVGLAGVPPSPLPRVDLVVNADAVPSGGNVTLSWTSADTNACAASDAWSGAKSSSGTQTVVPTATSRYVLTCTGAGGTATDQVVVSVSAPAVALRPPPTNPPPVAAPTPTPIPVTASLSATPMWVSPGTSTTLRWSSTGATQCAGSGGWSGNKPMSGTVTTGPITADTTFSLSCGGGPGTALATTTVSTRTARLTWQAPSVADAATIAGFRVDYGNAPGNYDAGVSIADRSVRSTTLTLSPGTYYFAMRALDGTGREIARSNEASKTIQ